MDEKLKPWCETCGKPVHEILCPVCAKWWADNSPPSRNDVLEEAARELAKRLLANADRWSNDYFNGFDAARSAVLEMRDQTDG